MTNLYLTIQAALFPNFMTANPKIFWLELAILATMAPVRAIRAPEPESQALPA
ncbi:hypothetical protein [Sphingorhabdus sp. YGSMI21]|uniref:hypothetical protein n=1 Tax=Sphingorhabdus sp. YGSMI21 TaxID=2077182 RepID=UPI0013DD78FE|nr:hypothetical protein [Sphingorhabdus sp. YGSMI21]